MALNGFSVLLFAPPASEVLSELKRTIYTAFCPFIIRLELPHNALEKKVYYDLANTLYYFSNKERKRIGRPEVKGIAKWEGSSPLPPFEMPPMIKRRMTKPVVYSISVSFSIFAYNSNKQYIILMLTTGGPRHLNSNFCQAI